MDIFDNFRYWNCFTTHYQTSADTLLQRQPYRLHVLHHHLPHHNLGQLQADAGQEGGHSDGVLGD